MNLVRLRISKPSRARRHSTILSIVGVALVTLIVVRAETSPGASKKGTPDTCDIQFSQLGENAALTRRTELNAEYLYSIFTTALQNRKWIRLAKKSGPDSGILFFDSEFSVLQKINTLTNDKNLATSLTNKNKSITLAAIDRLKKKYGGEFDFVPYSDFKSVRIAIVPKKAAQKGKTTAQHELLPALKTELAELFKSTNDEYSKFVKDQGFNVDGEVEDWFRAGVGFTADEATFAARSSRDIGGANELRFFDDKAIQTNMKAYLGWAESTRQIDIVPDPAMAPLLNGSFVKDDVLDIVKKTPGVNEARARLKAKYGAELDDTQVERLQRYNELIDKFSAGIWVDERKVASLEPADSGGLVADFSGLSAKNRDATARAIAESTDIRSAIRLAREGEQSVTRKFKAETKAFKKAIEPFLGMTISSGDDFVGYASQALSDNQKAALINEVAKLKRPAGQRIAFIADGIAPENRNLIGAHGEAIEKLLRRELEGKIPWRILENVVFGIDMTTKTAGDGVVRLVTGKGPKAALEEGDPAIIDAAFQEAVRKFNLNPAKGSPATRYQTGSKQTTSTSPSGRPQ